MALMERTPCRHTTRRLEQPRGLPPTRRQPNLVAERLAVEHNRAVHDYGSDSGGYHAYRPPDQASMGVYDGGPFPEDTVVTRLSWGRIDAGLAQRVLEGDGWTGCPRCMAAFDVGAGCGCGYQIADGDRR